MFDFGVGIRDGGTGGGGAEQIVLVGDSSAAAAVVGVVAENGAAAAAARQLAAKEDPGEGVTEVFRQKNKQQRVDVEGGENQAMSDDLNGDKGFRSGMGRHVLDE